MQVYFFKLQASSVCTLGAAALALKPYPCTNHMDMASRMDMDTDTDMDMDMDTANESGWKPALQAGLVARAHLLTARST